MGGGDERGNDLAVELSWPDAQAVSTRRLSPEPAPAPPAKGAASGPGAAPAAKAPATPTRPKGVTPEQVLAAVQRVGADVTVLGRALGDRSDGDRGSGAISRRVAALESALDQLRRSLLDAIAGTEAKLEGPTGLPGVQHALAGLEPIAGQQRALARAVQELSNRLTRMGPGGAGPPAVDAGSAVSDALETFGGRLTSIEAAAQRVADDASTIVERVAPLPARLTAIATQVDRITPLARAGDDAGSLFARLDRVETGVEEVVAHLRAQAEGPDDDDRFEGVVDVLAGVSQRQDELTTVMEAVLDRLSQRPDLAGDLDQLRRSLLDALARTATTLEGPSGLGGMQAALVRLESIPSQQRALGRAVQELGSRLTNLGPVGADPAVAQAIEAFGERLASIEAAASRVSADASAVVERVGPLPARLTAIATQVDRLTPLARAGDDAGSLFDRLNRVESGLGEVVALLGSKPERSGDDDRFGAVADVLAGLSHRQEELALAMEAVLDRLSERPDLDSVLDRVEHREQLLIDRLDRIEARLPRRNGGRAGPAGVAGIEDTLLGVLEHLTTLSSLVTGTSQASSAELDALHRRIVDSLSSFDEARATMQKELAERPPLSDLDVSRIAEAVTQGLLENVRVETDRDGE